MGKVSLFIAWDVQLIVEFNKVSGRVDSVKARGLHLLFMLPSYLLHIFLCFFWTWFTCISLWTFYLIPSSYLSCCCGSIFPIFVSWPLLQHPNNNPLADQPASSSCYLPSHKIYLGLMLLSVWLRDSDCVILNMSHWFKVCKDLCVCLMITTKDGFKSMFARVYVCVLWGSCLVCVRQG